MTLIKFSVAAIIAAGLSHSAFAQDSGSYSAIGAATYDFETYGVDVKLGHDFNENFGIEAQGIIGLTSDSTLLSNAANSATLKQKTDYTIGVFAVGRVPLSEQFDIFARAGVHNTKYGFTINNALGTEFESNDTGLAVGGGLQYNLNAQDALRLETTYLDNVDSQTTAISFVRKF